MSFAAGECGFERGGTKVSLEHPPVILSRDAQSIVSRSVEIGWAGDAIVTETVRTQGEPKLHLRIAQISEANKDLLKSLYDGTGPVDVKTGKRATFPTIKCRFGPMWKAEPINGHYADTDDEGNDPPGLLTALWWVELEVWKQ